MIPIGILRELFKYNYWARDRQLEACASLTPEQFHRVRWEAASPRCMTLSCIS